MFDYDDNKITLTTDSHLFVYENNELTITNLLDNANPEEIGIGKLVSKYPMSNNKEFEKEMNFLLKTWLLVDSKPITIEHLKFLSKIKDELDIQLYVKCDCDWSKFIEEEEKERV